MNYFVVLSQMMNGKEVTGVFQDENSAKKFSSGPTVSNGLVEKVTLEENLELGASLYAAHHYDDHYEVHIFDQLYVCKEEAKKKVGEKGMVLKMELES